MRKLQDYYNTHNTPPTERRLVANGFLNKYNIIIVIVWLVWCITFYHRVRRMRDVKNDFNNNNNKRTVTE